MTTIDSRMPTRTNRAVHAAAPPRLALLLQDTAEFPSLSMKRYAASLSEGLSRVGGEVGWQIEMPEVHEPAALARVAGRANASRWGRLVRYPARIRRWRRDLRPAVCHVLDHSHANLLTACDPDTSVATIHDLIPMLAAVGELDFKVGRWMRHTFDLKLRRIARCRRVIAISQSTKRQLLRFVDIPADRIEVVYYGVAKGFAPLADDGERLAERATVLNRHGIDPGRHVVLHVCTPMRYKNSPAMLHALTMLPPEVVLLRVGATLFDDERALAERLGVSGRVIDVGTVHGEAALATDYRSADVLAFPSTFEGFGWPPLEAMACGTPVVLSDAASLPEAGGAAALYAGPHDHAALAAGIDRLLSDSAEHARRQALGLAHAQTFTWDRCARQTAHVYGAVAETA
jgi:glycosyltransferase involved in cell wall biosynthesis